MSSKQLSMFNFKETTLEQRLKTLDEVEKVCSECHKCKLSKTRTNVVFADGNPSAKVMLIGEAPGQQEDEQGKPFVGRAGQLLDKILLSQNITRERDIYICNTVKCRPPENRVPKPEEKTACRDYLEAQIQLIRPKIILICGATALKSMIEGDHSISKVRGKWFDGFLGSKMMPIFHPSYLLRNQSKAQGSPRWLMWQDIQEIRKAMDAL